MTPDVIEKQATWLTKHSPVERWGIFFACCALLYAAPKVGVPWPVIYVLMVPAAVAGGLVVAAEVKKVRDGLRDYLDQRSKAA